MQRVPRLRHLPPFQPQVVANIMLHSYNPLKRVARYTPCLQTNAQLLQSSHHRFVLNRMAELASAPSARAVIDSMGFDHDMVQHALAQAGGNEQLAINLILNGEVYAATASTSAASIADGSGSAVPAASFSGRARTAAAAAAAAAAAVTPSSSLCPLPPQQQRVQIKRPLELMQVAAWFFALQSPGMKRHQEEPPPPLGHMLAEFSPCVPVRFMCGCVATACRRLATAPAGVHVIYKTTWRWAGWIMERVTRGRVAEYQVCCS
jgi:hypothetical protein